MSAEQLKQLEFKARLMAARAQEVRTEIASALGQDCNLALLAAGVVGETAALASALCKANPGAPETTTPNGRWTVKAGAR